MKFLIPKYKFKWFFSTLTFFFFFTFFINFYTLYSTLNYTKSLHLRIPRKQSD